MTTDRITEIEQRGTLASSQMIRSDTPFIALTPSERDELCAEARKVEGLELQVDQYFEVMHTNQHLSAERARLMARIAELKAESEDNYVQGQKKGVIDAGSGALLARAESAEAQVASDAKTIVRAFDQLCDYLAWTRRFPTSDESNARANLQRAIVALHEEKLREFKRFIEVTSERNAALAAVESVRDGLRKIAYVDRDGLGNVVRDNSWCGNVAFETLSQLPTPGSTTKGPVKETCANTANADNSPATGSNVPCMASNAAPAKSDPSQDAAKTLIYLATPYTHSDVKVREARFHAINKVAADLMRQGMHIFSPISHTHPIAEAGDLPRGWEFWQQYDRAILASCGKLIVVQLDGWDESKGVAGEIAIANELGIPVEFLLPPAPTGSAGQPGEGKGKPDVETIVHLLTTEITNEAGLLAINPSNERARGRRIGLETAVEIIRRHLTTPTPLAAEPVSAPQGGDDATKDTDQQFADRILSTITKAQRERDEARRAVAERDAEIQRLGDKLAVREQEWNGVHSFVCRELEATKVELRDTKAARDALMESPRTFSVRAEIAAAFDEMGTLFRDRKFAVMSLSDCFNNVAAKLRQADAR